MVFGYINSSCQTNSFNINFYDFDVNYLPENSLHVIAKAEIVMLKDEKKIALLTNSNISINSVQMVLNWEKTNIDYKMNGTDSVGVTLPSGYSDRKIELLFDYNYKIDSLIGGSVVLYFWYPYQWNNLTKFSIKAAIPSDYIIYTPGNTEAPLPRLNLILAKKNAFIRRIEKAGQKEINFYFTTADTSLQTKFISESVGSFKYFSDLIGTYPYNQLSIFEVRHSDGAYVNSQPAFILADERLMDYYFKGQFDWPPHEVAHQWIGSGMFVQHNSPGNSCLFEPLADYLRLMSLAETKGKESFYKELDELKSEYVTDYVAAKQDVPLCDAGSSRVTYLKGAFVMHQLRNIMGDAKWKDFLKDLFNQYKGKFITYDDFKVELNKFGRAYMDKYITWTTTPGLPSE
jgi:hypothetical protein